MGAGRFPTRRLFLNFPFAVRPPRWMLARFNLLDLAASHAAFNLRHAFSPRVLAAAVAAARGGEGGKTEAAAAAAEEEEK